MGTHVPKHVSLVEKYSLGRRNILSAGSVQLTTTRNKEVFQNMEIEDLTYACRVGDHNTVVTLLKSGDVDVNERDRRNVTALMWAMGRNHIPIVSTLLANPTIQL